MAAFRWRQRISCLKISLFGSFYIFLNWSSFVDSALNSRRYFEHSDTAVIFQHVQEDSRSGDIYVLDQFNRIYHLSADLKHISEGPIGGRSESAANPESQLFLLDELSNRILACSPGSCYVTSTNRSGAAWSLHQLDQSIRANVFTEGQVVIGSVSEQVKPSGTRSQFHVAALSSACHETSLPFLSVRQYSGLTQTNFSYPSRNGQDAALFVHQTVRPDFPMKPVFLATPRLYNNRSKTSYGYLITLQPHQNIRKYITRIGRFCVCDTLTSYTELTLTCSNEKGGYSIAMLASFQELAVAGDQQLAVTFGKWEKGMDVDKQFGTATCVYSVKDLNKRFDKEIEDCYAYAETSGGRYATKIKRTSLLWVTGQEKECNYSRLLDDQLRCYSTKNSYIDGSALIAGSQGKPFPVTSSKPYSFWDTMAAVRLSLPIENTSLASIPALLMVEAGKLKLLALANGAKNGEVLADVSLEPADSRRTWNKVSASSLVAKQGGSFVLLSRNQIASFPVGCGIYDDCKECQTKAHAKLACGWCEGDCATSNDCLTVNRTWTNITCPPVITDVQPKNGSAKGGTLVSVTGRRFGSVEANVTVVVAGTLFVIETWNQTNIFCKTGSVDGTTTGSVGVTITNKESPRFFVNGTTKSRNGRIFQYSTPTIESIWPPFGPLWGGTLVTLRGNDFNTGVKQEVKIGVTNCRIEFANSTTVSCRTNPAFTEGVEAPIDSSVSLWIDGAEFPALPSVTFQYRRNPETTSLDRDSTIYSGGTVLQLHGTGFSSTVIAPELLVTRGQRPDGSRDMYSVKTICLLVNDSNVSCPTPSIKAHFPNATETMAMNLTVILDGDHHRIFPFTFYPDPVFREFQWLQTQKHKDSLLFELQLNGEHLTSGLQRTDYEVTVGGFPCYVNMLSEKELDCFINSIKHVTGTEVDVKVKYGHGAIEKKKFRFSPPVYREVSRSGSSDEDNGTLLGGAVGSAVAGVFIIVSCIAAVIMLKRQKNRQLKEEKAREQLMRTDYDLMMKIPLMPQPIKDLLDVYTSYDLVIEPDRVEQGKEIGKGNFGIVYEGLVRGKICAPGSESQDSEYLNSANDFIKVAIKTLDDLRTKHDLENFLNEGLLMKDFAHKNVMTLLGVCVTDSNGTLTGHSKLILPLMSSGDLHSFLRKSPIVLTMDDMLNIAMQIAEGMEYLSNKRFIHRDLAARNCMLDENRQVKVADFGLSKDIYEKNYYSHKLSNSETQLPVRWMAPECLDPEQQLFTLKSDVWSYGIVLWEVLLRGARPYPHIVKPEYLLDYIQNGGRLTQPSNCPHKLYDIMMACWCIDPEDRPDFSTLLSEISSLRSALLENLVLNDLYFTQSSGSLASSVYSC